MDSKQNYPWRWSGAKPPPRIEASQQASEERPTSMTITTGDAMEQTDQGQTVTEKVQTGEYGITKTGQPRRKPGPKSKARKIILNKSVAKLVQSNPDISPVEIGKELGISKNTAVKVLANYGINHVELEEYKANRADIFAGLQRKIAQSLSDEPDLKKVPYRDRVIAVGVIGDKERLERGESTTNVLGIVKVLKAADQQ